MKFYKLEWWILHLGQSNCQAEERLDISPAEKDLGVLVGSRVNRSQQQALAAKRANCTWGASNTV